MAENLILGVMHEELMEASFVRSLTAVSQLGVPIIYTMGPTSRLDFGRNQIFRDFVDRGAHEWLLMIDTDMVFTPQDVGRLIESADPERNPITGGLYIQGHTERPVAWKLKDGDYRYWDFKDKRELVTVDAIGFGFTAVHRSVIETCYANEVLPSDNRRMGPNGQALGDDLSFCDLASRTLGYRITLNTRVRLGHTKSITWYPKEES